MTTTAEHQAGARIDLREGSTCEPFTQSSDSVTDDDRLADGRCGNDDGCRSNLLDDDRTCRLTDDHALTRGAAADAHGDERGDGESQETRTRNEMAKSFHGGSI